MGVGAELSDNHSGKNMKTCTNKSQQEARSYPSVLLRCVAGSQMPEWRITDKYAHEYSSKLRIYTDSTHLLLPNQLTKHHKKATRVKQQKNAHGVRRKHVNKATVSEGWPSDWNRACRPLHTTQCVQMQGCAQTTLFTWHWNLVFCSFWDWTATTCKGIPFHSLDDISVFIMEHVRVLLEPWFLLSKTNSTGENKDITLPTSGSQAWPPRHYSSATYTIEVSNTNSKL